MTSASIIEITKATIAVMEAVKGIEKNLTVGSGNSSYQGVADRDVKKIIGEEMVKNGLAIFPVGVEDETRVDSWDETSQYGTKRKQSVFTKVKTTYLLTHTSGEFITIQGFGHGVDSQDKSAGKATTYALKYALLYAFMVPTGKIDDADNTHSDEHQQPQQQPQPERWMTEKEYNSYMKRILDGEAGIVENCKKHYKMKKEYLAGLEQAVKDTPNYMKEGGK